MAADDAEPGKRNRLVLVGTPIGDLEELAPRARAALTDADVIGCEDTRKLRWLLREAGIPLPGRTLVVNEHTEDDAAAEIVRLLDEGLGVALVSDAGMPGISDPGARAVRAALDAGHEVCVVNGPSAMVHALVASGLPSGRFVFEGFLPRSGGSRRSRLDAVAAEPRTVVLFEAPHRLAKLLEELAARMEPDRPVALCRELTKTHEEIWRGTVGTALGHIAHAPPRGEFVVVLGGAEAAAGGPDAGPSDEELADAVVALVTGGASTKDAVAEVAARFGVARNRVYSLARQPPGSRS